MNCKMMEGKVWVCVKGGLNTLDLDFDFSHNSLIKVKQESARDTAQLGVWGENCLSYLSYPRSRFGVITLVLY